MIRTASSPVAVSTPVRGVAVNTLLARIAKWMAVASERRRLAALPAERLADIGLDADGAWAEASRPFWDAPCRG